MKLFTVAHFILFSFVWISTASSCPQETAPQKSAQPAAATATSQSPQIAKLEYRLKLAAGNRSELEKALRTAPEEHRKAVFFLISNMGRADLKTLSADYILKEVRLAYEARESFPWEDQISEAMFLNNVLPYANINEKRESWRAELLEICQPIVKDCKTTEQAAQAINQQLFKIVKVKYSTKRKRADQSPSESIEQGLASCTGLSILLIDACRSVNVPARLVGIPSWTDKRGNHTWVEIWSDGDWHFTGAAEYNADGLDRAWFTKSASLADKSSKQHSIYATSFAKTKTTFPGWSLDWRNPVFAINVTDRYTANKKLDEPKTKANKDDIVVRVRVWNADKTARVVVPIEVRLAEDQSSLGKGKSTGNEADMNDMFETTLKQNTKYEIRLGAGDTIKTHQFTTNKSKTQLVEIEMTK